LEPYPYWDYFIALNRKGPLFTPEYYSALFYTKAYTRDDDSFVICCIKGSEQYIMANGSKILSLLKTHVDNIERPKLEVIPIYEI
jgi:hypothetical protein